MRAGPANTQENLIPIYYHEGKQLFVILSLDSFRVEKKLREMCEGVFSSLMSFFNFNCYFQMRPLRSKVHSLSWKISGGQTVSVIWQNAQNATFSLKTFSLFVSSAQAGGQGSESKREGSRCSRHLINMSNTSNWPDLLPELLLLRRERERKKRERRFERRVETESLQLYNLQIPRVMCVNGWTRRDRSQKSGARC